MAGALPYVEGTKPGFSGRFCKTASRITSSPVAMVNRAVSAHFVTSVSTIHDDDADPLPWLTRRITSLPSSVAIQRATDRFPAPMLWPIVRSEISIGLSSCNHPPSKRAYHSLCRLTKHRHEFRHTLRSMTSSTTNNSSGLNTLPMLTLIKVISQGLA